MSGGQMLKWLCFLVFALTIAAVLFHTYFPTRP
jgi:hypothetical protein